MMLGRPGEPLNPAMPRSRDAVIIVPGIMGSELVESDTGKVLWGLADPGWYVRAWTTGSSLNALKLTHDERAGRTGRIAARRLLTAPAFAPALRGIEPYSDLVSAVRRISADHDAVLEFAYDWRLSIQHNAKELAKVAEWHLANWRRHKAGSRDARLVFVAHSMGGLIVRHFLTALGGDVEARTTVTIGTPFYGAVKAVHILSTGHGAPIPLPHRRLQALARTLPGVYDLLPSFRCVDEGARIRVLTPADVGGLGGDPQLAEEAASRRVRLGLAGGHRIRPIVGVEQPTMQSVAVRSGVAEAQYFTYEDDPSGDTRRVDRRGDSTVSRDAAALAGGEPVYLPQAHGALAKTDEVISHVCAVLTETILGPPEAGAVAIGLDAPDVTTAGEEFRVGVVTLDDPAAATCRIVDAATGAQRARVFFVQRDGSMTATVRLDHPGIYRIEVKGGGFSAVTQLVMVVPPQNLPAGGHLR